MMLLIAAFGGVLAASPATAHTISTGRAEKAVRTAAQALGDVDGAQCWRPFKAIHARDRHRAVCVAWWVHSASGASCVVFYEVRMNRGPSRRLRVLQTFQPWCQSTPQP
jgi:hypothetical protein